MSRTKNQGLLTSLDRQRFLTAVQYELFLSDLELSDLDDFALLQRLAETASPDTLQRVLSELTQPETVDLLYYALEHYREGSYTIVSTIEKIYPIDHPLQRLIQGFRHYYYDLKTKVPLDLVKLLAFQEVYARQQTDICFQLFSRLIDLIIESPVNMASIAPSDPEKVAQQKQLLQERFRFQPSLAEFRNFTRRFGLYHQIPFFWQGVRQPETSLHDKLQLLCTLFERPQALPDIPPDELVPIFSFVLNILLHLETMHRHADNYLEGLQGLTCAIPTHGKRLAALPGLPSLLRGLHGVLPSLINYPVFIYDQSDEELYGLNQDYISELSNQYKCPILHLSLSDILTLAKRTGIEPLLNTTRKGSLGFGGARNCVFLLTPVLRHLFDDGHRTPSAMLNVEATQLKRLLQTYVLGKAKTPGDTLLMIDDDMEIPPANLFCHALFSHEAALRYSCSASFAIGRATKFNIIYPSLSQVLYDPKAAFASHLWSNEICSASMSEYVSKPKVCLNIPFGSEEQHLRGVMEMNPLLHPSIHLAGARYPTGSLPTRPWCGLEEYLSWYIPYSIQVAMTMSLLDPINREERSALPWNQKEHLQSFANLRAAAHFIASEEQQKEMKNRFWHNVALFYQCKAEEMHLLVAIKDLINCNSDKILKTYQNEHPLNPMERNSLKKIGELYAFYQKDASLLWKFTGMVLGGTEIDQARAILEKKGRLSFAQLPLTNGLYLLFRSIGMAEFNQLLKGLEEE